MEYLTDWIKAREWVQFQGIREVELTLYEDGTITNIEKKKITA